MAKEASINDFGLVIAFVLPDFTALWGASYLSDALRNWIGANSAEAATVGGFLYLTVAAIGAGMAVSTVRWLVIDPIHHRTGVRPPQWDFSQLRENAAAFGIIVDHYYRYYQCAANTFVSLVLVFAARRWSMGFFVVSFDPVDLGLLALMAVFFVGSRDSLQRYYTRGGQLLRATGHGKRKRRAWGGAKRAQALRERSLPEEP
jgi:hypothetical protein